MSDIKYAEYRVEYMSNYGDYAGWQPRYDIHKTMADAVRELSHINDCKGYDFRIVKREVTAWEVVQ